MNESGCTVRFSYIHRSPDTNSAKNMKKSVLLFVLYLLQTTIVCAESDSLAYLFKLSDDKRFTPTWCDAENAPVSSRAVQVQVITSQTRFTAETGFGYDLLPSPEKGKSQPYYFSVQVPDGNYRVVVTLGSRKAEGNTTVRAESRRLMLENVHTRKGEFKQFAFIINKRSPQINEKESVHIKPREKNKLNWDEKLTLEINGTNPQCASIQIEPIHDVPTIFLCGNSTVVDQDEEPWASWGQMIPRFFNDKVSVANYAESGESATSFVVEGRLKKILSTLKAGDFLLMEFGHNDQKLKGPGVGAFYSFATCLKTYIDEVRQRGATPILVTPAQRRSFKGNRIVDTHADYPDAIRWLAECEQVTLIDLHKITRSLFESMGPEGSKNAFVHYPAHTYPGQDKPLADNTHFNPYGAYQIAQCIVEEIRRQQLPLVKFLRSDVPHYNPLSPTLPEVFLWIESPFIDLQKPDGN